MKWRIIEITSDMSDTAKMAAARLNSLGSLFWFQKYTLRRTRLSPSLHGLLCAKFEQSSLRLALEVPRDHFKTTIASVGAPMWWALPFNDHDEELMRAVGYGDEWIRWMRRAHFSSTRTLIASETIKNAVKIGTIISGHYESNALFRNLFPEIIPKTSKDWGEKKKKRWNLESMTHNRIDGEHHGEGTYDFIGVKGALQSRHYDRQVIDDPVGEKAIASDLVMESTIDWIRKLTGAVDSEAGQPDKLADQLFIGNRWSNRDVGAWLRKNTPNMKFETHSAEGGCCPDHPKHGEPIFPEEFSMDKLRELRQIWGGYNYACTPGETPILMADWTEKPISEVVEGDKVIGYKKDRGRWILVVSTVIQKHNVGVKAIVKCSTVGGRSFRCTPDHNWFTGRNDDHHSTYLPAKTGRTVISIYTPHPKPAGNDQRLYDWLGGMFDGEGTCIGNPSISQAECNPEVQAEIARVLSHLKIPFKLGHRNRNNSDWSKGSNYVLNGGRSTKVRLLQYAHMVKRKRFEDALWRGNRRIATRGGNHKVTKISKEPSENVYGLTTTTGNYVAWGYASQNSQYLNNPIDPEAVRFKPAWLRYYTQVPMHSAGVSIANSQQINYHPTPEMVMRDQAKAELSGEIPERLIMAIQHEVQSGEVIEDMRAGEMHRVAIMDPNHSEENGRSRNAIVVLGMYNDPKKPRRIYLLDVWAEASSHETMIDRLIGTRPERLGLAVKWRVHHIYVESEVAGQQGWKFLLKDRVSRMGVHASFSIRPLKTDRSAGGKDKRIIGMESLYENGLFWVRRTGQEAFMQEYEQYPNGATKDILDIIGYSPQTWEPGSRVGSREFVREELQRRQAMIQSVGVAGY